MPVAGGAAHVVDRPRGPLDELAEAVQCRVWNRRARRPQVVLVEHAGDEALRLARTGSASAPRSRCMRPPLDAPARSTARASRPRSPSRCACRSWRTAAGRRPGRCGRPRSARRPRGSCASARSRTRATGIRRVPAFDASSTSASDANSGGSASPAGDEVPRLPPTVPRLRIWGDPTVRDAIASPGRRSPSSAISRAYVTPAPTRRRPLSGPHSVSSAIRVRSRTPVGRRRSKLSSTIRSVPPAIGTASGICGFELERLVPAVGLEHLHRSG